MSHFGSFVEHPAASNIQIRRALLLSLCLLTGCGQDPAALQTQALYSSSAWFTQARSFIKAELKEPPTCHAFGLVKFTDASCLDMADHAGRLDPATREIESVDLIKCFGQGAKEVCGEFVEIWFTSQTESGLSVREGMVLKRDNDDFRMYWYRSDTLFTELNDRITRTEASSASGQQDAKQQRLDAAYTQIVERDPGIYTYPKCIDAQVSSSAMVGDLMSLTEINAELLEQRAQQCSQHLCLSLVGKRIAALCL